MAFAALMAEQCIKNPGTENVFLQ